MRCFLQKSSDGCRCSGSHPSDHTQGMRPNQCSPSLLRPQEPPLCLPNILRHLWGRRAASDLHARTAYQRGATTDRATATATSLDRPRCSRRARLEPRVGRRVLGREARERRRGVLVKRALEVASGQAVSQSEAARMLGVTPAAINRRIERGTLSSRKVGYHVLIPVKEIERARKAKEKREAEKL